MIITTINIPTESNEIISSVVFLMLNLAIGIRIALNRNIKDARLLYALIPVTGPIYLSLFLPRAITSQERGSFVVLLKKRIQKYGFLYGLLSFFMGGYMLIGFIGFCATILSAIFSWPIYFNGLETYSIKHRLYVSTMDALFFIWGLHYFKAIRIKIINTELINSA